MEKTYNIPVADGAKPVKAELDLVNNRVIVTYEGEFTPKDGNICVLVGHPKCVFIYNENGWHKTSFYIGINSGGELFIDGFSRGRAMAGDDPCRLATPEEAQRLFDALKKEGKRWNAEKKRIEDIPKPFDIKKGDVFRCIKNSKMVGEGWIAYVEGRIYISEHDGCITDERGSYRHEWTYSAVEYFVKLGSLNNG